VNPTQKGCFFPILILNFILSLCQYFLLIYLQLL